VIVTNSLGQEISIEKNYNRSYIDFDINGKGGLYFLKIKSGGKSRVLKIVKMSDR
jgi:hypothetical protein